MRELTYDHLVAKEGIVICVLCWTGVACRTSLDYGRPAGEWADISNGTLHWRNRKVTKPGLRNFLKLWASVYLNHNRGQPQWEILHQQNVQAYRQARYYGVILPKRLSRNDRILALLSMQDVHPKPQPAYQWAKENLS